MFCTDAAFFVFSYLARFPPRALHLPTRELKTKPSGASQTDLPYAEPRCMHPQQRGVTCRIYTSLKIPRMLTTRSISCSLWLPWSPASCEAQVHSRYLYLKKSMSRCNYSVCLCDHPALYLGPRCCCCCCCSDDEIAVHSKTGFFLSQRISRFIASKYTILTLTFCIM